MSKVQKVFCLHIRALQYDFMARSGQLLKEFKVAPVKDFKRTKLLKFNNVFGLGRSVRILFFKLRKEGRWRKKKRRCTIRPISRVVNRL